MGALSFQSMVSTGSPSVGFTPPLRLTPDRTGEGETVLWRTRQGLPLCRPYAIACPRASGRRHGRAQAVAVVSKRGDHRGRRWPVVAGVGGDYPLLAVGDRDDEEEARQLSCLLLSRPKSTSLATLTAASSAFQVGGAQGFRLQWTSRR